MNRIIRNIPSAITLINLAAGTAAIICASQGDAPLRGLAAYEWSYIFIAIAAVADFFDGFAARLLHAYSELGKELDSLCDMVSFGVAPAMLLYNCILANEGPEWLAWCALLIPLCGALRLARFNIDNRQTTSFIGLPIPANAIFWIGFTAMYYQLSVMSQWFVLGAILAVSWLMVSGLRLFSFKFRQYRWSGNAPRYITAAAAFALLILCGIPGLMWLIVFYICMSVAFPGASR